MKTSNINGVPTPTANIAINKGRLKVYNKKSEAPTYYLQKGQEFEIELFNPTTGNILAKISLNGKPIAQGGLVLRPGERVFLDRYIDVARKFKFDTYEVANTNEVKKAIENNGDFKVEFYSEYIPPAPDVSIGITNLANQGNLGLYGATFDLTSFSDVQAIATASVGANGFRSKYEKTASHKPVKKLKSKRSISRDTIETGRVEMGSASNQKMTTVNMDWLTIPFHTVEYKMLPVSQKINTTQSINVKRYCTNCGTKQKPNFKFCPNCGTKC
jgi:ribosomal 50S subunit-recycling heat shock protein